MNFKILILLFLILCSCNNRQYDSIVRKSAIKINDKIYFDNFEVDLESWCSYYTWKLQHEGPPAAAKVLPDSTKVEPGVWKFLTTKAPIFDDNVAMLTYQPIGNFYQTCRQFVTYDKSLNGVVGEPEYCPLRLFPITGITYEQAVEFCKWRSLVKGEGIVEFRLPTEAEWKELALNGLNSSGLKNGLQDSLHRSGCPMYNYKFMNPCKKFQEGDYPSPRQIGIGKFIPIKNQALDVFGNVSEMTATKGVSKGGNYRTFAKDCNVDAVQNYTTPEVWLGFRCIAEIKN